MSVALIIHDKLVGSRAVCLLGTFDMIKHGHENVEKTLW
ncbi:hypothetical protein S7335_2355 [Synechococcus sp. PCC 7335]|nr:hypothetical protein S7335_2355 [Synechococcus sp. PCC 7335]